MKKVTFLFLSLLFVGVGKAQTRNDAEAAVATLEKVSAENYTEYLQSTENKYNLYVVAMTDLQRGVLFAESKEDVEHPTGQNLLENENGSLDGLVGRCGKWSHYTGINTNIEINGKDTRQQFAFIYHKGSFYMYNVATEAFCVISHIKSTQLGLSKERTETVSLVPVTSGNQTYLTLVLGDNTRVNISNGAGHYHAVRLVSYNVNSPTEGLDGGNQIVLYKVDEGLAEEQYRGIIQQIEKITIAAIESLIEESKTLIENYRNGVVGYPKNNDDNSSIINALQEKIKEYGEDGDEIEDYDAYLAELQSAVATCKSLTDVNLPVSGKAYRIKAKYANGNYRYIYDNGTKDSPNLTVTAENAGPDTQGLSDVFICTQNTNGEYSMVHNNGHYLIYCCDDKGGMSNILTGFSKEYLGTGKNSTDKNKKAVLTFTHNISNTDNKAGGLGTVNPENIFGSLCIRAYNYKDDYDSSPLMAGTENFHSSYSADIAYTDTRSSFFYFEEAEYPNTPTLNATDLGDKETNEEVGIATFSAPFATVAPEGVKVYIVSATNDDDSAATLSRIADNGDGVNNMAIPANTGVILYGQPRQITMLPATSETVAEVNGNLLSHTAGTAKTIESGNSTIYILGSNNNETAFYLSNPGTLAMNKAYLDLSTNQPVRSISLNFGQQVTNIETAISTNETDATLYDLSGRRVTNAAKGGIYILNGKKVFVK